jgi:hypothetical protein
MENNSSNDDDDDGEMGARLLIFLELRIVLHGRICGV